MGRKGGSRHLKRPASPSFWPIHRKEEKWTLKPSPGPHPTQKSVPLLIVVRDILRLAGTGREAGFILSRGKVRVDGKATMDKKFPVGVMDVIEVSGLAKAYRVVPSSHRFIAFQPVPPEEKTFKLCRIEDKKVVDGGNVQLNLHDGRNILVKVNDPSKTVEDVYKVLDVVRINFPKNEVASHLPFREGTYAMVVDGKNIGKHGTITSIARTSPTVPTTVKIKTAGGFEYSTTSDNVFVVGEEKPLISLPQG